jgi:hypothetical protein
MQDLRWRRMPCGVQYARSPDHPSLVPVEQAGVSTELLHSGKYANSPDQAAGLFTRWVSGMRAKGLHSSRSMVIAYVAGQHGPPWNAIAHMGHQRLPRMRAAPRSSSI